MPTLTLSEIAKLCGAALEGDGSRTVVGPAALRDAGAEHVSFCAHPRYGRELSTTRAAGVLVPSSLQVDRPDLTLLRCEDAHRAFTEVVRAFARTPERPDPGVHPSAVVHPTAVIDPTAAIGPTVRAPCSTPRSRWGARLSWGRRRSSSRWSSSTRTSRSARAA